MTSLEKLINKFKRKPESLKYREIEKLLISFGFEKILIKGSHIKFKHLKFGNDLVIPIHNNECKDFYKKQVLKFVNKLK